MNINLYVAHLVVGEKEMPLTAKIAKQFPVLQLSTRWDQAFAGTPSKPVFRVLAESIDKDRHGWLMLVESGSSFAWVEPLTQEIGSFPGDKLDEIPHVILA